MTAEPNPLAEALAKLQGRLPVIEKTRVGDAGSYKYNYADLAQITAKVMPILSDLGLSFSCRPTLIGERFVLEYELLHTSGQSKTGQYPLPDRASPQQIGSAVTYGRRYCLCATIGLCADEDDDGAQAEAAARKPAQRNTRNRATSVAQEATQVPEATMRKLQMLFRDKGISDRTQRLTMVAEIIGREVSSANELTRAEADSVIDKLNSGANQ